MAKKSNSLPVSEASTIAYKPSKADIDRERTYRAESDIRTLKEAAEIKADRDRVKACKDHAKKQMKIVGKV